MSLKLFSTSLLEAGLLTVLHIFTHFKRAMSEINIYAYTAIYKHALEPSQSQAQVTELFTTKSYV